VSQFPEATPKFPTKSTSTIHDLLAAVTPQNVTDITSSYGRSRYIDATMYDAELLG
jgi:hypothetical protein